MSSQFSRCRLSQTLICLLLVGLGVLQSAGAVEVGKEHQLKAAFVYNFTKFVEWPLNRFPDTNSPIVIGVVGKATITAALESVVKDRKINGRDILVKTVETLEEARVAHLLFLPASEDKRLNDFLAPLATAGVLTVGESSAFTRERGMINFVLENDKVRFDFDMEAVDRAGIKISAQLQKLAKTIRRKN